MCRKGRADGSQNVRSREARILAGDEAGTDREAEQAEIRALAKRKKARRRAPRFTVTSRRASGSDDAGRCSR